VLRAAVDPGLDVCADMKIAKQKRFSLHLFGRCVFLHVINDDFINHFIYLKSHF